MIKPAEKLNPLRPVQNGKLSPTTVELAWRYLSGEFRDGIKPADFALSPTEKEGLSDNRIYAETILMIAEKAPLRLVSGEKLAGAATLLEAAQHNTPACEYRATSHVTIGFSKVLHSGTGKLDERVNMRLKDSSLSNKQRDFLESMQLCLQAMKIWHQRYLEALEELAEDDHRAANWLSMLNYCRNVPENPPQNFREAVQSLWMLFSFQRLCGNWSGLGRIDEMLGLYLDKDLKEKRITLNEARELLAHFWIKGTEWNGIGFGNGFSGDAQFYQNVILGGRDVSGREVTNNVTYLILDIIEELHISDYPVSVRLNPESPSQLLQRVAEVMSMGGGIVSIYNEPVVVEGMLRFGYSESEARSFTNDGCWETIIPGKTAFTYKPFDMLQVFQKTLDAAHTRPDDFTTFDKLYDDFLDRLENFCREQDRQAATCFAKDFRSGNGDPLSPTPLLSLFVDDCIEQAASYNDRGAKYNVAAIHAGGIPDTANSFHVIRKLVYEENRMSLSGLLDLIKCNWSGNEVIRQQIAAEYELYGNDNAEADAMFKRVFDDYTRIAGSAHDIDGVLRPVGISTFGRELAYSKDRYATVFGKFAGEYLAANLAPTPGTDRHGPTAVIKSFCKADFHKTPNGCPLDLKLHSSGGSDAAVIKSLINTFIDLGGFYMQLDVVDNAVLKDAQEHPDRYPNLVVRISGWSARFNSLDRHWQDMVINRTSQLTG